MPAEGENFFSVLRERIIGTVYPDDQNRVFTALTMENAMEEAANNGIFTLSYSLMINDEPRYVQLKAAMIDEEYGRRMVVGVNDIDAQVRQEEEYSRRLAQAMTKEAYESAVNTGLMYNHIAQTLARDYTEMFYVNTDTEEFTEYHKEEGGSTLSEIRHGWHFFTDCKADLSESVYPDDREAFLSAMNRKKLMKALSHKDTFVITYRRMVSGKPLYFSMKISRMEQDEQYIIIGFTDVDAEMRETMAKNEALSEALSSAEAANRSKNTFLSGMSHEIRALINAIIGLDSLALKNDDLSPDTRNYLEKIGDSAAQLLSLINDILNMSRIESGRETLHNARFSLSAMLGQINAQARSQCSEKGLEYDNIMLNQPDDTYIGDDKKLMNVLENILSNAVKFTEAPEKVTMTVEKTAEFEDRTSLRFRIKDTGSGMDREFINELFGEYTPGSTKHSSAGSKGLGLKITKRIVDMMNGSVSVESEKGMGTQVSVTVTLLKGDRQEAEFTGEIDLRALNILVVDDDPIEAEHAGTVLVEAGIRADYCTSVEEALRRMEVQHVRKQPYSIVLMDWNMPGMNGLEASKTIRSMAREDAKRIPIIALTGNSFDEDVQLSMQAGMNAHLTKPVEADHLLRILGELIYEAEQTL